MPAGFDSADEFKEWFDGPREVAERLWSDLQAEAAHDHGDAGAFIEGIKNGSGYIADVGVEILSGVDVPAIDSQMLTLKSETGEVWGGERDVLLRKDDDEDRRISYAAAMIPREPDKEGDVVSTPQVERAAHNYMKALQSDTDDGTGVDTDHNLIDDKGYVVESHILDETREYDLPDGTTKSHGAGTWVVGIEWEPETWQRVKSGDIEGLSIYGMAEQLPLERSASRSALGKEFVVPFADESVVQVLYASRDVAAKAAERMGFEGDEEAITHPHPFMDETHYMPAPSHDEYVDAYNEFAEADGFGPTGDDGEMVEASATAKDDADPCWEGHTMVGTDENGDPRCVPSDEVPDATGFENAKVMDGSGPPSDGRTAAADGQTVKDATGEPSNQNGPMSDDPSNDDGGAADGAAKDDGDAAGVDTGAIASEVADAVKEELNDRGESAEKVEADEVEDEAADLAEALGVGVADVMDALGPMLDDDPEEMAAENDGDDYDEDDDEESKSAAEKRADSDPNFEKGYSGEGVRENETEDGEAAVDGNPLASRERAAKAWEEGQ